MKINELKGKELQGLLTELFGLKGAKEIFKKHNIEMITKETELQGLKGFIDLVNKAFKDSKAVQEYKQAVMFLETQINSNKSMLKTAEGFMKTMLEGMIAGFETTKKTAIDSQSTLFRAEIKELQDNILNEKDRETIIKLIDEMTLDNFDKFVENVNKIEKQILERYSKETTIEENVVEKEEVKLIKEKTETKKVEKEKHVEKVKVVPDDNIDEALADFDLSDLDNDEDEIETKEETKQEPKKEESKEKSKKEETKPIEDDFDFSDDFDENEEDMELDFGELDGVSDDEEIDPFL